MIIGTQRVAMLRPHVQGRAGCAAGRSIPALKIEEHCNTSTVTIYQYIRTRKEIGVYNCIMPSADYGFHPEDSDRTGRLEMDGFKC